MTELNPACPIDSLPVFDKRFPLVDVLRLDLLHPVISGNKWFKLRHYLTEAKTTGQTLLTFGGAYSNHLVATAFAAASAGVKSIGVVRGEQPPLLSPTLRQAAACGMKLFFTTREAYRNKTVPPNVLAECPIDSLYIVPEGGYGQKGMEGAKDILLENKTSAYSHIITAVGTGTTVAGLAAAAAEGQKVIGIPVLKNNFSLEHEIRRLLPTEKAHAFSLFHGYHFGGYARKTPELFNFMNDLYAKLLFLPILCTRPKPFTLYLTC